MLPPKKTRNKKYRTLAAKHYRAIGMKHSSSQTHQCSLPHLSSLAYLIFYNFVYSALSNTLQTHHSSFAGHQGLPGVSIRSRPVAAKALLLIDNDGGGDSRRDLPHTDNDHPRTAANDLRRSKALRNGSQTIRPWSNSDVHHRTMQSTKARHPTGASVRRGVNTHDTKQPNTRPYNPGQTSNQYHPNAHKLHRVRAFLNFNKRRRQFRLKKDNSPNMRSREQTPAERRMKATTKTPGGSHPGP